MPAEQIKKLPPEKRMQLENSYKFYAFAITAILAGVMVLVLGIYWAVFPLDPLAINQSPAPALAPSYNRGQAAEFTFDFCKHTNAKGRVERFLVGNDLEVRLPAYEEEVKKGCQSLVANVKIPDDGSVLVPGRYFVRYRVTYILTPLKRTAIEEFETEKFDIPQ